MRLDFVTSAGASLPGFAPTPGSTYLPNAPAPAQTTCVAPVSLPDSALPTAAAAPFSAAAGIFNPADGRWRFWGQVDKSWTWASVTKAVFAYSVWIACDKGYLQLSQPAPPPAPPGATVADLLGHTTGLDFDAPRQLSPLRTRRRYSNLNFNILGSVLTEATGMSVGRWVSQELFAPLGITRSRLVGSPANSGFGPLRDLATIAQEMAHPTLVGAGTWNDYSKPYLPGLPGVLPGFGFQKDNQWALGMELRAQKSPHWMAPAAPPEAFGHFGVSGSFIWVNPGNGQAGVFLGAEPFGKWHAQNWPQLNTELIAALSEI